MIDAVSEPIKLRSLTNRHKTKNEKTVELFWTRSKWPFDLFVCFFLVDLNTVKYVHRSDTVHTLYTYIKYVYIFIFIDIYTQITVTNGKGGG